MPLRPQVLTGGGPGRAGPQRPLWLYGVIAFGVVVTLLNTVYVIDQRTQALILRLGQPVRTVNAQTAPSPGLKLKWPFVETVVKMERRNQALEVQQEEIIAADQTRLLVDAFVRYRIDNPLTYFIALRDEQVARDRIERLVNSSLRQVLGSASSNDIISGQRDALMRRILLDVQQRARASRFGVSILDVRIKRADLPQANEEAVYRRMQTARQQEAAQARAVGEQQKREIMAAADKEVAVTLATATEYGETVRGEGDARRAALFNDAFGRDPAFAAFYRSMQAYETALARGDTTMVLSPDSDFFRYFRNGPGGG